MTSRPFLVSLPTLKNLSQPLMPIFEEPRTRWSWIPLSSQQEYLARILEFNFGSTNVPRSIKNKERRVKIDDIEMLDEKLIKLFNKDESYSI